MLLLKPLSSSKDAKGTASSNLPLFTVNQIPCGVATCRSSSTSSDQHSLDLKRGSGLNHCNDSGHKLPFPNRLKLCMSYSRVRTYTEMTMTLITVLGSDCGLHNVDGRRAINSGSCCCAMCIPQGEASWLWVQINMNDPCKELPLTVRRQERSGRCLLGTRSV